MWGFVAYATATSVMVYSYPTDAIATPTYWPQLWWLGAAMVSAGGYWFWFFIRVDVAAEGNSPFRFVRADLFVVSLVLSTTFALIWAYCQATASSMTLVALALYLISTTVLFGSVPWSKFSHMFFKPAAAYQKNLAHLNGGRNHLPAPADKPAILGKPKNIVTIIRIEKLQEREMPTFVYMTACDGCGHCVDICPSDIMHIDPTTRRAVNIEPNFCWECYSCVKACPQNAIDDRGYSDFAPMGHKVRVLREPEKGTISWRLKFRDGREKNFVSPIRTTEWGSIKCASEYEQPSTASFDSAELAHEPDYLKADGGLRTISKQQFKKHPIAKEKTSSLKAAE